MLGATVNGKPLTSSATNLARQNCMPERLFVDSAAAVAGMRHLRETMQLHGRRTTAIAMIRFVQITSAPFTDFLGQLVETLCEKPPLPPALPPPPTVEGVVSLRLFLQVVPLRVELKGMFETDAQAFADCVCCISMCPRRLPQPFVVRAMAGCIRSANASTYPVEISPSPAAACVSGAIT